MRDAELGEPLRALLRVIAEQVDLVDDDIAQLYENWFIETCEDWVVPYLGDLVGYRPHRPARPSAGRPGSPPAATSPTRSRAGAARARWRCWRSWPPTSPAGRRARSSSTGCSAVAQSTRPPAPGPRADRSTCAPATRSSALDGPFDEARAHRRPSRASRQRRRRSRFGHPGRRRCTSGGCGRTRSPRRPRSASTAPAATTPSASSATTRR